jgi:hypothetical protein
METCGQEGKSMKHIKPMSKPSSACSEVIQTIVEGIRFYGFFTYMDQWIKCVKGEGSPGKIECFT